MTSTTTFLPHAHGPMEAAAAAIEDLLEQLGVDTSEPKDNGDPDMALEPAVAIKETVASAAVRAYTESLAQLERNGFCPPGKVASVRVRPSIYREPWHSITVRTLAIDKRPYADERTTFEVTFTGGHPSNMEGLELPFATRPPFDADEDAKRYANTTSFPSSSPEKRKRQNEERIKTLIKSVLPAGGWVADRTAGEIARMGDRYLERFEHVEGWTFGNVYRVVIVNPNMD